jgi:5S rRNA maturation endonuclease (ribonuclease M5)
MVMICKILKTMNLKKIKSIIFDNIELVLNSLGIEYEVLGDNIYSTCPIHEGSDNSRAFSMSLEKQIWRCWTRDCQAEYENDIFGLIKGVLSKQTVQEASFKDSLLWVCKILNIDSRSIKIEKTEEPSDFVKLVGIFSKTPHSAYKAETNHQHSFSHPSEYFVGRGFTEETLHYFSVGDCFDKSSSMYQRAVIPIHNDDGTHVVAHIGRAIKDYHSPKFLFTKGFDKRRFLYNYHRAIDRATEQSCLFITEGQGDVWKLHEAGVGNAVSIFGKSLSTQQRLKLLTSGTTTLVILTDNDQAGRESKTEIQRGLGRMFKLHFPRMTHKDVGDMTSDQIRSDILSQVKGLY